MKYNYVDSVHFKKKFLKMKELKVVWEKVNMRHFKYLSNATLSILFLILH